MFDNKDIRKARHNHFPHFKSKKDSQGTLQNRPATMACYPVGHGEWKTQPYIIHLHESILNNFNFDYVYNYFFNPEKVKGQTYKPLRSPSFKEAVVVTEASETSKKITADKNVFFFEDFSTTAPGKKPIGWQTKFANSGTTAVVTHPEWIRWKLG